MHYYEGRMEDRLRYRNGEGGGGSGGGGCSGRRGREDGQIQGIQKNTDEHSSKKLFIPLFYFIDVIHHPMKKVSSEANIS